MVINMLPAEYVYDESIAKDPCEPHTGDDYSGNIVPRSGDEGKVIPVRMDKIIIGVVDMGRSIGGVRCHGGERR